MTSVFGMSVQRVLYFGLHRNAVSRVEVHVIDDAMRDPRLVDKVIKHPFPKCRRIAVPCIQDLVREQNFRTRAFVLIRNMSWRHGR